MSSTARSTSGQKMFMGIFYYRHAADGRWWQTCKCSYRFFPVGQPSYRCIGLHSHKPGFTQQGRSVSVLSQCTDVLRFPVAQFGSLAWRGVLARASLGSAEFYSHKIVIYFHRSFSYVLFKFVPTDFIFYSSFIHRLITDFYLLTLYVFVFKIHFTFQMSFVVDSEVYGSRPVECRDRSLSGGRDAWIDVIG